MPDPLAARRRDQDALLRKAHEYMTRLSTDLHVTAAAVVGSVARGDFNVWSDVDIVVVADDFPVRALDRGTILVANAQGGVQAIGFTPQEFAAAWEAGNPIAREAVEHGIVIAGGDFFSRYDPRPIHSSPPS